MYIYTVKIRNGRCSYKDVDMIGAAMLKCSRIKFTYMTFYILYVGICI